jgi:hypothetical protein
MAFLKESPRSLSLFFVLSGVGGLLTSLSELGVLSNVAQQTGGLSGVGQIYQVMVYVFITIAIVLLVSGVFFRRIATSLPMMAPTVLVAAIVLKLAVIAMLPTTAIQGGITTAICAYLLIQYRRISGELATSSAGTT